MSTKCFCDRCDVEIDAHQPSSFRVVSPGEKIKDADLCTTCLKQMKAAVLTAWDFPSGR